MYALARAWSYVRSNYWEFPANILEGITFVLVVFVQDLIFKESIVICAGLLTASFLLHGIAYKAGQCQVWPKAIELAAPLLFYCMIPLAYLHPYGTYKAAFIIINFWFVAAEALFWACGRNFIADYLQDWNPKEVWGTPLLDHCAVAVALSWIICQVIMGLAQVAVVAANISIDTNAPAAIIMCYVMQLLPLLWAIVFTFAYPARVKRRWGYVYGVRASCYPSPKIISGADTCVAGVKDAHVAIIRGGNDGGCSSGKSQDPTDMHIMVGKEDSAYLAVEEAKGNGSSSCADIENLVAAEQAKTDSHHQQQQDNNTHC